MVYRLPTPQEVSTDLPAWQSSYHSHALINYHRFLVRIKDGCFAGEKIFVNMLRTSTVRIYIYIFRNSYISVH